MAAYLIDLCRKFYNDFAGFGRFGVAANGGADLKIESGVHCYPISSYSVSCGRKVCTGWNGFIELPCTVTIIPNAPVLSSNLVGEFNVEM